MNNAFRSLCRLNRLRPVLSPANKLASSSTISLYQQVLTRNLWSVSSVRSNPPFASVKHVQLNGISDLCSCGCGTRGIHSKGERELVEFLTEEILAERKAQKVKTIPTEVDGFHVKLNGAEVTLRKEVEDESITIRFNVNHTVETNDSEYETPEEAKSIKELKSKPSFKIDLARGETTVCLQCSFIDSGEDGEFDDVFGIDEISIYNGDWNENVYAVSGEVVDTYLYDLLMNYLEEKGVSNEFVEKLSEYSTAYEHSAYIGLLEGLSKFAAGK